MVLYQPEIPPNTGNIIRLCANTGASLHLIEPCGFTLDEPRLRRAGLDYREWVDVKVWASLGAFLDGVTPGRMLAFSRHAQRSYTTVDYCKGDALLFGPETRGLPDSLMTTIPGAHQIRIPMRPDNRSLNLSNAVAVASYEAWRQLDFEGSE